MHIGIRVTLFQQNVDEIQNWSQIINSIVDMVSRKSVVNALSVRHGSNGHRPVGMFSLNCRVFKTQISFATNWSRVKLARQVAHVNKVKVCVTICTLNLIKFTYISLLMRRRNAD